MTKTQFEGIDRCGGAAALVAAERRKLHLPSGEKYFGAARAQRS